MDFQTVTDTAMYPHISSSAQDATKLSIPWHRYAAVIFEEQEKRLLSAHLLQNCTEEKKVRILITEQKLTT